MKSVVFGVMVLFAAAAAHAGEIYKWTDAKGVVHYGNRPVAGAKSLGAEIKYDADAHEKRLERERLERRINNLEDRVDRLRAAASRPRKVIVQLAPAAIQNQSVVMSGGSGYYDLNEGRYRRRRPVVVVPRQVPARLQWRRYWDRREPYYKRHMTPVPFSK